jgi:hypothetical protein
MMIVSYFSRRRSRRISASRMPSVITFTRVSGPVWSVNRTCQPITSPSSVPVSAASRSAIVRAAIRRGCVWPIIRRRRCRRPSRPTRSTSPPRPSSRHIFGICVVLPDPVSPAMMTTWFASSAAMISSWRALAGSCGG